MKFLEKIKQNRIEKQRLRKLDEEKKNNALSKKFIEVSFNFVFPKTKTQNQAKKFGEEALSVLQNYISEGHQFVKNFNYIIERKTSKEWSIRICPKNKSGEIEKYSYSELEQDIDLLIDLVSDYLDFVGLYSGQDSFNPIFIDQKPAIQKLIGEILSIKYKIEDRQKYWELAYEEDEKCLGSSVDEYYQIVNTDNFKAGIFPTKKELALINRWIKETGKLIKNN
jgi:hypothetical protein